MLTDTEIRAAKPKPKPYKLTDSKGLHLLCTASGSKLWYLKYYYRKKEKKIAFGAYPIITLRKARELQFEAQKLLLEGKDPGHERRIAAARLDEGNTLEAVARQWFKRHRDSWASNTQATKLRRMELYIFPELGKVQIDEITPRMLLKTLEKIQDQGAREVARRMRQQLHAIFKYAIINEKASSDPTLPLEGALKTNKTKHFAAISCSELPEFLHIMQCNEARMYPETRIAMELLMLTFVRTSELLKATWDEFDFERKIWTIPAERMKMRLDHQVPLSRQVVSLLQMLKKLQPRSNWVLPSRSNWKRHCSNNTILSALVRMGYRGKMTGHGFRSLAMSTIKERLGYRHEVVDRQLAHVAPSTITRAYDRAQFMDERTKMMQDWADFIDVTRKTA